MLCCFRPSGSDANAPPGTNLPAPTPTITLAVSDTVVKHRTRDLPPAVAGLDSAWQHDVDFPHGEKPWQQQSREYDQHKSDATPQPVNAQRVLYGQHADEHGVHQVQHRDDNIIQGQYTDTCGAYSQDHNIIMQGQHTVAAAMFSHLSGLDSPAAPSSAFFSAREGSFAGSEQGDSLQLPLDFQLPSEAATCRPAGQQHHRGHAGLSSISTDEILVSDATHVGVTITGRSTIQRRAGPPGEAAQGARGLVDARGTSTESQAGCASITRQIDGKAVLGPMGPSAEQLERLIPNMTKDQLLQEVLELLGKHRLCQAVEVLHRYCKETGQAPDSLATELKEQGLDLEDILQSCVHLKAAMEDEKSDEGWNQVAHGDLQLFYSHTPWTSVHCFRARCILDAPLEHPVALGREFDLNKEWNKYCLKSIFLKEYSDGDVLCFATMWAPWPLPNIDVAVRAVVDDMLDCGGWVGASVVTPKEMPPDVEVPPTWGKNMQARFLPGSYGLFRPLPPTTPGGTSRTQTVVSLNLDPGIKVPGFLISFVLRIMAPYIYRQAVHVLHRSFSLPDSKYLCRLEQRKDLYTVIKQHVAEDLDSKVLEALKHKK